MKAAATDPLRTRRTAGFSLVELVVFIVLVGVSLAGVLLSVQRGMSESGGPHIRYRVIELAQLYLDEIVSRRYDQQTPLGGTPSCVTTTSCTAVAAFGPDGGEARAAWNDVDDYHALKEGNAAVCQTANPLSSATLRDSRGLARAGYDGYCVEVEVAYDGDFDGVANEAGAQELAAKRIRVTATAFDGTTFTFAAYRGGF